MKKEAIFKTITELIEICNSTDDQADLKQFQREHLKSAYHELAVTALKLGHSADFKHISLEHTRKFISGAIVLGLEKPFPQLLKHMEILGVRGKSKRH